MIVYKYNNSYNIALDQAFHFVRTKSSLRYAYLNVVSKNRSFRAIPKDGINMNGMTLYERGFRLLTDLNEDQLTDLSIFSEYYFIHPDSMKVNRIGNIFETFSQNNQIRNTNDGGDNTASGGGIDFDDCNFVNSYNESK